VNYQVSFIVIESPIRLNLDLRFHLAVCGIFAAMSSHFSIDYR